MSRWAPWSVRAEPGALLRYVRPDVVGMACPSLPEASPDAPADVLERIYEIIAGLRVRYQQEPTGSGPAGQYVRGPDEVLARPRHATCLDLAVVFAGACERAGLRSKLLIVGGLGRDDHALLVVETAPGRPVRDPVGAELAGPTEAMTDGDVRTDPYGAGALIALDVARSAAHRSDGADPAPFAAAVAAGATLLADLVGGRRVWRAGVDVGAGFDKDRTADPGPAPALDVLTGPYHPPGERVGPLAQLRARNGIVPFVARAELDTLRAWCEAEPVGVIAVYGTGGAGKTHLAAELCRRQVEDGWYAGFLSPLAEPAELEWLGGVISPVLAVVDYAEDAEPKDLARLIALMHARTAERPGWVLLTARARTTGGWQDQLSRILTTKGLPPIRLERTLPRRHPRTTGVFRRAYSAFGGWREQVDPPAQVDRDRWTTLDLVLLGYLAAHRDGALPRTRGQLYDEILDEHELPYWRDVAADRRKLSLESADLAQVGAVVTLFSPTRDRVAAVLSGVEALSDSAANRASLAGVLGELLPAEPGEGRLAIRPDLVGGHLVLRELANSARAPLYARTVAAVVAPIPGEGEDSQQARVASEISTAYENLTRTAENDRELAEWLAALALHRQPDSWPAAFNTALRQGGPFVPILESLARARHLPAASLHDAIPPGHAALRDVALTMAEQLVQDAPDDTDEDEQSAKARAVVLNNLAVRLSAVGRHEDALTTATEAVTTYRQLAQANPAAFLPDLAGSLNNLATFQSEVGRREDALTTATEAVTLRRQLAQANPAAFLPDLAMSLNNLANRLAAVGRREDALTTATEAVTTYRQLAQANPAAFLPDLAMSLNNLASRLAAVGRHEDALTTATEAVTTYRQLAQANPAAFLPDLAMSLNNLANVQSEVGRREDALTTAAEAVTTYRQLAQANPAALLPDLAKSLNNLANRLAAVGRREDALTTAAEAVTTYRQLAQANPAALLPDLAMSLSNLANVQSAVGRREDALTTATEAVTLRRQLAQANPAAFLPDLAGSLNNLATFQSEVGRREDALTTAAEAVTTYRQLAQANPAALLPDLAGSLNNLASRLSAVGRREDALTTATEAVTLRRQLAQANPAAFLPDLAMSLSNLATFQSEVGRREDALTTATEAVTTYRQLAQANPAALLPDLAMSLNNLATFQSEVGRREDALTTATEAVTTYRQLAQANPAALLPDLAMSLNNLANVQSEVGRREDALTTATEAVTLRRQLAQANPAAFLPDLAASLNNLATFQSEVGRREDALTTATEAVTTYRQLAQANPAAFLPNLATSLNNLASQLSAVGRREDALTTATEAVTLRRQLAQANPAAFVPDLATSLNNLANRLSEVGRREEALTTATEAVTLRRQLAQANPAAFLPDLATSLNNLANRLSEVGRREEALTTATEAVTLRRQLAQANPAAFLPKLLTSATTLARVRLASGTADDAADAYVFAGLGLSPAARAHLIAARATGRSEPTAARMDLLEAAQLADADPERGLAAAARRAVRSATDAAPSTGSDGTAGPAWLGRAYPTDLVDAANRWFTAEDAPEQAAALTALLDATSGPSGAADLDVIVALHADTPSVANLADLLESAREFGPDAVAAARHATEQRRADLKAWLQTPTWYASRAFLDTHPDMLADPAVLRLLEESRADPLIARHFGIARLAARLPLDEIYDLITDPADATGAVLDAVERGDRDLISDLVLVAPDLLRVPFLAPYLAGAAALLGGDDATAADMITRAAQDAHDAGDFDAPAAAAARLRRLARRRPELRTRIEQLTVILNTDADRAPNPSG